MSSKINKRRIKFETGIAIASAGSDTHTKTLPRGFIKKLEITVGTAITVSAGSVVANTSIKTIIVRYNGKQIIYITGLSYDDLPSAGIELLREINKHIHQVAEPDDYFALNFPAPLAPADVQLQWINQSAQNIGADAANTITAGAHDIELEIVDRGSRTPIIPYITSWLWNDSNNTGDFYRYLQALPYRLRMLAFITHDSGTRSNTTYDSLVIEDKGQGKTLFDGQMGKLQAEFQRKSGVAMGTGNFIKTFGKAGLKVLPDTILCKFTAGTAGTDKFIECIAICY